MKIGKKIQLLSGQHIEAVHVNSMGDGIAYLTGPSDFIGKKPFATKYTEFPKIVCDKGDILLTVKGSGTGSIAIADRAYCISRQLMAIRCMGIDSVFTQYLIEQNESRFNKLAVGLIPGISRSDVLNLLFPEISIYEQKAIADLLSIWDEAIEKTERVIQGKEKRFKGLMQELINDNGQLTTRKLGWKKVKLGDLFRNDIIVEKGKPLTKMDISQGSIPVVAGGQTYAYYTNVATHEMPTVTVSASGAYAGFIWYHDYPIWASDCNVLFVINGDTKFLFFALKSIQERVYALQSGGAQPHVYSKDMKSLTISWPSTEERQLIAEKLSAAQHEIDILKQLLEKYKTQKRGLMQKLLTSEWRVKTEID